MKNFKNNFPKKNRQKDKKKSESRFDHKSSNFSDSNKNKRNIKQVNSNDESNLTQTNNLKEICLGNPIQMINIKIN